MKNKSRIAVVGGVFFLIGTILSFVQFSDDIEIHTLKPVSVYTNEGWPDVQRNPAIGVLPPGTTVGAATIVDKDHMAYRIEYKIAAQKASIGYVIFNGYCDGEMEEVRVVHHLFGSDERQFPDCSRANKVLQ
jgi:hypothetical protein